jgi:hypothetical protein
VSVMQYPYIVAISISQLNYNSTMSTTTPPSI